MNAPTPTGGTSSGSAPPVSTLSEGDNTETSSQEGGRSTAMANWGPSWAANTHLVFNPGSNKVMLTNQLPLIRTTIQDAFDSLQATLLFENAFPDPNLMVLFLRKTLVGTARSCLPNMVNIYNWLLLDDAYMDKLMRLVSDSTLKDM